MTYSEILTQRLWSYRSATFPNQEALFDTQLSRVPNPPVFTREASHRNVIVPDDPELAALVLKLVPRAKRHKWFRSMKSSQALAQSVFGNLKVLHRTSCLSEVTADDDAIPAFGTGPIGPSDIELEHDVSSLNEVRATSVDVLVSGSTSIYVECKLSEQEVGCCSRPRLKKGHPEYCDGSFARQGGRSHRCALTERGMSYWEHIPSVLNWEVDRDLTPCPLAKPYQLVRNVLAAAVIEGKVRPDRGHALLVYDDRNPAFQPRDHGPFEELRAQLRDATMLRRCSWQAILTAMDRHDDLQWLVRALDRKYGLACIIHQCARSQSRWPVWVLEGPVAAMNGHQWAAEAICSSDGGAWRSIGAAVTTPPARGCLVMRPGRPLRWRGAERAGEARPDDRVGM